MAETKTKKTSASVSEFLKALPDEQVRKDCQAIAKIMQSATKDKPAMWGPSIVGFGRCTIQYAGGREAEWMLAAFSPRKGKIALYSMGGFKDYDALLARLGPHERGGGCLYIKRLAGVHLPTLTKIVNESVKHRRKGSKG